MPVIIKYQKVATDQFVGLLLLNLLNFKLCV